MDTDRYREYVSWLDAASEGRAPGGYLQGDTRQQQEARELARKSLASLDELWKILFSAIGFFIPILKEVISFCYRLINNVLNMTEHGKVSPALGYRTRYRVVFVILGLFMFKKLVIYRLGLVLNPRSKCPLAHVCRLVLVALGPLLD